MTASNRRLPPLRRTSMPQSPDWSLRVPTRSSREAGPSARDRRLVFARAFGCCESCGASVIGRPYTIAARVVRDVGDAPRAEASAQWNLTLLCGSAASPGGCQLLREQRDPILHRRGIWLWSWENPRMVPLLLVDPAGPRVPAWLNADGTYDFEAPPAAGDQAGPHRRSWPELVRTRRVG